MVWIKVCNTSSNSNARKMSLKNFFNFVKNIENCTNLNTLVLKDCYFVDDWVCAKIAHTFSESLVNLDLSNCKLVTDNGLIKLSYLT